MPVLSETKQLLPLRLKLVFCNQFVVTHPFETNGLLADFANSKVSRTATGVARSLRVDVSRTAGLSSSLRVETSRCGCRSRRGCRIFSPLSNELHMPALLYLGSNGISTLLCVVAPALRGTILSYLNHRKQPTQSRRDRLCALRSPFIACHSVHCSSHKNY